ncbi:MAG TPA: trehalose-phosphatase [Solirubrobacteraceae bacterium]|nr:trehalose-phosphatase [Solirubrobacteraceae bacterium]
MSAAVTLGDLLAPVRDDPPGSAVLLDVDGTLAPIVRHAADASVPEPTRARLIEIARRYGLLACVTGRRAADARRMVSIGSIAYVGNHGAEVLRPGATRAEVEPALAQSARQVHDFVRRVRSQELDRLRVRIEDKDVIVAFHWRGAPDEVGAQAAVEELGRQAESAGLWTHRGRKVLEVRPPVPLDKGVGVRTLLRSSGLSTALYVGDDVTDLDAFRALGEMAAGGELGRAMRIGVRSDEGPPEIEREADGVVDGPDGVRLLLDSLLGE